MAYFFITNKKSLYENTKRNIEETDFKISFDYNTGGDVFALATHKLMFENVNFACDGENFCIATGTCIYNESLDYRRLLNDFSGDVIRARNNTIGQYGVCIKKGNKISVYGDPCGCYNVYYWKSEDGSWIVSSSLFHMAKVLQGLITFDHFSLVERVFYRTLLNGETFFKEICRLRGTESLLIDVLNGKIENKQIKVEFPTGGFNEMVDKIVQSYKNNARIVEKVLGTPTICATGGLDSRIILTAFLSVGVKPTLLYGYGNNIITAPKNEDIIILNKMNKSLGLKIKPGDFSVSDPLDKDWDRYIKTNGFRTAYMWGAQRNVIESLSKDNKLLMFGWGGEYLRRSWYHFYNTPTHSIDELLDKWHEMHKFEGLEKDIPDYRKKIEKHFYKECEYLGLNPKCLSEDDLYLIEIAWGAQADTQIPSFMQQYNYCYLMSFEYNIQKYRVTAGERENAKFMIAIMHKLYPTLLKEPIFTHEQLVSLNESTMSLEPFQTSLDIMYKKKIIKLVRQYTPNILKKICFQPIVRLFSFFLTPPKIVTERPDFIIKSLDSLEKNVDCLKISNIYDYFDVAQYAILLRALRILKY